ncbi:MAG TPA: MFS transporter, partial [Deinococcales bacterium]|nr:MFS transporter [Deinococcales bacterium]
MSTPTAAARGSSQDRNYKWLALSVTSLGALLASMNGGTLIIALPTLMKELQASLLSLIWILLAYNLTQTVLVLNVGRLSDMFGRKSLYVLGFAVFTLASLGAGFSNTVNALIALRVLQGIGGGLMIANSSAIVTDAFPLKELGLALGTNQMLVAVGSIAGPILGGWLTTLGWHWVFWFNVPLGVVGTIWAAVNLRETTVKLDRRDPIDVWGNLTYAAGLGLLMIGLSKGGIESWASSAWLLAAGAVLTAAFVAIEFRTRKPMLDLSLFRDVAFSLGNATAFLNAIVRSALTFLFVFYFQGAWGLDPVVAGVALVPQALGLLLAAPLAGRLADRRGPKALVQAGLALTTVAFAGFALILRLHTPYVLLGVLMFVNGVGSGLFNSPNTSSIMGRVAPDRRGVAAGLRSLLISVGAILATIFALSIVSATLPRDVMFKVFSGLASSVPAS